MAEVLSDDVPEDTVEEPVEELEVVVPEDFSDEVEVIDVVVLLLDEAEDGFDGVVSDADGMLGRMISGVFPKKSLLSSAVSLSGDPSEAVFDEVSLDEVPPCQLLVIL